jgi:hypothetical protein
MERNVGCCCCVDVVIFFGYKKKKKWKYDEDGCVCVLYVSEFSVFVSRFLVFFGRFVFVVVERDIIAYVIKYNFCDQ